MDPTNPVSPEKVIQEMAFTGNDALNDNQNDYGHIRAQPDVHRPHIMYDYDSATASAKMNEQSFLRPKAAPPASMPPPPPPSSLQADEAAGAAAAAAGAGAGWAQPSFAATQEDYYLSQDDPLLPPTSSATPPPLSPPPQNYHQFAPTIAGYGAIGPDNANAARPLNAPVITQYDEHESTATQGAYSYFAGVMGAANINLRPNTGQTNSYDLALMGMALHEIIQFLRFWTIATSVVLLFILFFTWWLRLVTLRLAQLVLSAYLGFVAIILVAAELIGTWSFQGHVYQYIQDQFGLVYHPLGKSFLLFFTATLCWAIGGFWEFLCGLSYFVNALMWLYLWCSDPQVRKPPYVPDDDDDDGTDPRETPVNLTSAAWSVYFPQTTTGRAFSTGLRDSASAVAAAAAATSWVTGAMGGTTATTATSTTATPPVAEVEAAERTRLVGISKQKMTTPSTNTKSKNKSPSRHK